jgi:hypothetical protein
VDPTGPRREKSFDLSQECRNSQSVFSLSALLRAFDGNLLRHEHGALRESTCLRGGDTELELALIESIDDLAHGCLIQTDSGNL